MAGLTPAEARVMDLWDAGHSFEQIMVITGQSRKTVQSIVALYNEADETRTARTMVTTGTQRLAVAIQQARHAA